MAPRAEREKGIVEIIDRSRRGPTSLFPTLCSLLHVFFACSLENERVKGRAHTVTSTGRERADDVGKRRERLNERASGGRAPPPLSSIGRLSHCRRRFPTCAGTHGGRSASIRLAAAHEAAAKSKAKRERRTWCPKRKRKKVVRYRISVLHFPFACSLFFLSGPPPFSSSSPFSLSPSDLVYTTPPRSL